MGELDGVSKVDVEAVSDDVTGELVVTGKLVVVMGLVVVFGWFVIFLKRSKSHWKMLVIIGKLVGGRSVSLLVDLSI